MTKILAIDDDKGNLELIKATMRKFIPDSQVFIAQSGKEGIRLAQKELPDTILIDIMMPEVNGYEVCKILKEKIETMHIPIIFFSAYVKDSKAIIKGLDLGADAFLEKPIAPAELAAQIRVMLRIKKAEDNLKKEISRYRIMTETLPDAVITINLKEEITYISPVAIELFGYQNASALIKKNAYKVLFSVKPEIARQMLKNVLLKDRVKEVEIVLLRKNGSSFIAEVSSSLIRNEKNEPIEFIIVIKDITKRKYTEIEILNYQKNLKSLNASLTQTEEKERKMIAGDLHDGIGQKLSLAHINLTSLTNFNFSNEAKDIIQESIDLINNAIAETRTLTINLSPPILFELGLVPALKWKLKQVEEKFGFKTFLKTDEAPFNLNNDIRILSYRIVSELIANIIKHAVADTISVAYYLKDNNLNISVKDNGIGFDYNPGHSITKNGGFGLFSIKERLDSVQGSLYITSTKQQGTIALISIPI